MKNINQFKGEYRFLSNFYEDAYIPYGKFFFKTGEHLYQALKTRSVSEATEIVWAATPGQAKKLGQKVTLRDDWEEVKVEAMRVTIGSKFLNNIDLRGQLIITGNAVLIEGNNWHDQTWGNCTCGRKQCDEPGKNLLGVLLMQLRTDLNKWLIPKF